MKSIYLGLFCCIFLFSGCSQHNVSIDRSKNFLKIKANNDFIKIKNLNYHNINNNHRCIKKAYKVRTQDLSEYGLLDIEHTELNSKCKRTISIDKLMEKILTKIDTNYKILENKTIGDFTFYTIKFKKEFELHTQIDKTPFMKFIIIEGANKGQTIIRDYFGFFYDELKNTISGGKLYHKELYTGKVLNKRIMIQKFGTIFNGLIIDTHNKKDYFLGQVFDNKFETTLSKTINFQGEVLNNTLNGNLLIDNSNIELELKKEKYAFNSFLEMITESKYNVYKGHLLPKDNNGIKIADLEVRVFKNKCISFLDFNHPEIEHLPIFLQGTCNINNNNIEGIFEKTDSNIKSLGTEIEVKFKGTISTDNIAGTYESSTNKEFQNKYFGTFLLYK